MAYLDTPHTEAGNQSYLSDAHHFQAENSFLSPLKKKDNLILQIRNDHGLSIRTPRARQPIDRHNALHAQAEFTPLLKSAVKGNRTKRVKAVTRTSSFTPSSTDSPALQTIDDSDYLGNDHNSFTGELSNHKPVPQIPSSSVQSTPLAMHSKEDNGILIEQRNKLTLKEQESMLDKIEKENFGLKLKIHFFEKMLQSADSGFNEAAVKENMNLKVDKVTMQRELGRTRKTLIAAEREVEAYRRQVQQAQEKAKKSLSDENTHKEFERLQQELENVSRENEKLRSSVESTEEQREVKFKLEEDLENLEAEVRERDRIIDAKDDEIEGLNEQVGQGLNHVANLEDSLNSTKEQLKEIQVAYDDSRDLRNRVRELEDRAATAMEKREVAVLGMQKAEDDLHELQMQLADTPFNAKGLNRQLEERIRQLQAELDQLRETATMHHQACDQKTQDNQVLEQRIDELRRQMDTKDRSFREDSYTLKREHNLAVEKQGELETQLQIAIEDNHKQSEITALLQIRHDAVTNDLQQLRKETIKYKARLAEAERTLDERQCLLGNEQASSNETKEELMSATSKLHEFQRQLQDAQAEFLAKKESWETEKCELELQSNKFEARVLSLQDLVGRLKESEGTISGKVGKLQEALVLERQRFKHEESTLYSQIQQLQGDLTRKNRSLETLQTKFVSVQEKLTESEYSQASREDKIQALEDEIEVLQCSLEECIDIQRNIQVTANIPRIQFNELKQGTKNELQTGPERMPNSAVGRSISKFKDHLTRVQCEKESSSGQLIPARGQLDAYDEVQKSKRRESIGGELELRTEVIKLQRKLIEAGQDIAKLQAESKQRDTAFKQERVEREAISKEAIANHEQDQEQLKLDLCEVRKQLSKTINESAAQDETYGRMRAQIEALERHLSQVSDSHEVAIAGERKDLHELLKKAKLEAEDLLTRLQERENDIQQRDLREKFLRNQLDCVQEDRNKQKNQSIALLSELETLQRRYEDSIESLQKKQTQWKEERKAITSRVRFPSASVSSIQANENSLLKSFQMEKRETEKRHAAEIQGLAKQIYWMKARHSREEGFRAGLIFEKKFLLLQVEMFNSCNALDLRLLEGMGVASKRNSTKVKPKLKVVGTMILATMRIQRLQRYWAGQQKTQASLAKKMMQMRCSKTASKIARS